MPSRLIQAIALAVMIVGTAVSGRLLSPIMTEIEDSGLRYTDVAVEGAPPWVAIGTMIGAFRGIIVDILWIKVDIMKSRGLYYEVMADAELITKLQPRFAEVWAFHGHNMAYNISVATHTQEERWEWVNAGIRLVRDQGLRHNPNNLVLHKELAFWFAHKIEGYSDDAHLYYKRQFAREWHFLLGDPPVGHEERIAWIKRIADAPDTLEETIVETPKVAELIDMLQESLALFDDSGGSFEPTAGFLRMYGEWLAMKRESTAAQVRGIIEDAQRDNPFFVKFDQIADDPTLQPAWDALIAFARKRVLIDEYNMDPQLMYEFTRDLGPIDWRHGQSHALYWSRRGSLFAEGRYATDDDIYKIINNDRLQLQAMQDLARYGRITYDPFSVEIPARFADPRWIDVIEGEFDRIYAKHFDARGGGPDTFATFLQNFMSSAIREAYRAGETERAKTLLAKLDALFGRGSKVQPNNQYAMPLDVFVTNQIKDQYSFQPHLAPSEAVATLRYAFRAAVGQPYNDQTKRKYDEALEFTRKVIKIFRENEMYAFETKFGEGRMRDLLSDLPTVKRNAFIQLMTDPGVPMAEKATIWAQIDRFDGGPRMRIETYDVIMPRLASQFSQHELSQVREFEKTFTAPPGLDLYRRQIAAERARQQKEREAEAARDDISRQEESGR